MQDITKESILKAIEIIDNDPSLLNGRESTQYDLIHKGKKYPPILVLSEANKLLGGEKLTIEDFGNNVSTAFELLKINEFEVQKKFSYYKQLKKFIEQAETNSLITNDYLKIYDGLNVKVSFGQGSVAKVPWIAFLNNTDTVQFGIYPVYLYYKEKRLLILAYGVSETNKPIRDWNIENKISVQKYFSEQRLGKPERYGESYVYKVYNTDEELNPLVIDNDLNEIIRIYKGGKLIKQDSYVENDTTITDEIIVHKNNMVTEFFKITQHSQLMISETLCYRFIGSLISKPFVILTGLSGSGKTKLAQSFAKWICLNKEQYVLVPVGADWTNREPLLGYPSALDANTYVVPENGVLQLLIDAVKNPDRPFFIILDEMNLSHVERYFADFLSAMESKEAIFLHSGLVDRESIPSTITLPDNLFIIGTVNIDETTYMFSPKVLDRANVIEFRVDEDEMKNFMAGNIIVDFSKLEQKGVSMAEDFLAKARAKYESSQLGQAIANDLLNFFNELKKVGAEFGYRTASEIMRFAEVVKQLNSGWIKEQTLDAAVMQKLLPKLHGSRRKLEGPLIALAELCLTDEHKSLGSEILNPKMAIDFTDTKKIKLPISLEKIRRMYLSLLNNNFTSYAEA